MTSKRAKFVGDVADPTFAAASEKPSPLDIRDRQGKSEIPERDELSPFMRRHLSPQPKPPSTESGT